MKKDKILWIILSILLTLNFGCARTPLKFKLGSEPEGFMGAEWGTVVSTMEGMVYAKSQVHPEDKVYINEDEIFRIDGVKLNEILYFFWKDRLYTIDISTKGYNNFKLLRKFVFNKFCRDEAMELRKEYFMYTWLGNATKVELSYFKPKQYGILRIESRAIAEEVREQTQKYLDSKKSK